MSTIFALSTVPGKAGIAVFRISGPDAVRFATQVAGSLPAPRTLGLRRIRDHRGELIDKGLVVFFPEGNSFTGEDLVELHLHGSMAVIGALTAELGRHSAARAAEPGEFTRRALENGCLDLTQVEGLADLIEAETEAQLRQAVRSLDGALGKRAAAWRRSLVFCMARIEASIDFADEDIPTGIALSILPELETTITEMRGEAEGVLVAERIREGFEVAIVGPVNIGKSTLLNRLSGREAAITSAYEGTTRDIIEVRMDLKGIPVTFLDTAGLRETGDPLEVMGIDRAIDRARKSDLRLFLLGRDGVVPSGIDVCEGDIVLQGKIDLEESVATRGVSGKTGEGVTELLEEIADKLGSKVSGIATATRMRHRTGLERAIKALERAETELQGHAVREEIAADYFRQAVLALDSIVGRVDVEELLGEIFASFCIGK